MKSGPFPLFLLLSSLLSISINAQEHKEHNATEEFKPYSTLGLVVSHAHVFAGVDESGKKKLLALPSWGIDYNYHISSKWAVGLHTDIIIESFKIESHAGETIERSYPIAPAFVGIYKPTHHWNLMAGAGAELAKEENFFLTRLAIEYGAGIGKGWEVFGSFAYDLKWNGYDSWVIGLGVSKELGKNHR